MNKVLNINLGGYALTIDDDAYEYLSSYLDNLRRRFSESEGRDEILRDIESRLGELISGSMGNRTIVMLPDVEAAIGIMGKPEDFGAEPIETRRTANAGKKSGGSIRTGRRLFRDEEDKVVSGVCSGLAAYFGIADPVWVRLVFVLLTFLSAGFWIPAYFLLLILVPPAKTAADRLAMRGEKINVDNIAREIEEGFDRLGNEFSGKKNDERRVNSAVASGVSAIGQLFAFAVRFVAKFAVLILILIGAGLFIALLISWASGIFGLLTAAPVIDYLSPFSGGLNYLGFANFFFLFGIPLLGICLLFARMVFKTRIPGWVGASLATFWALNLISGIALLSMGVKGYRQGGTLTRSFDLSGYTADTLRVEWAGGPADDDGYQWFGNDVIIGDDRVQLSGLVDVRVRRSESGRFECVQNISARGRSNTEALENAGKTEFNLVRDGNTLRIPTSYAIPRGEKWKGQRIRLTLYVPVGKYVVFGETINRHVHDTDYADEDANTYVFEYPNRVFRMTEKGLECADCPVFGDRDYRGNDRNYENFILEGDFVTEINKGDEFSLRIEGSQADRDLLKTIRTGDKISFTTQGKSTGGRVRIYIQTPVFTSLFADSTGPVTIRGFKEGVATITAKGNSRIKAFLDASSELGVTLNGASQLELNGQGGKLEASLTNGSILEAATWRAHSADISASEGSKARVHVEDDIVTRKDADSEIKIDGTPRVERDHEE